MDEPVKQPIGARALAAMVLRRVAPRDGARSNDALAQALSSHRGMDPRDRALTTELVYGCLRWQRRLDHALEPWVHRGISTLQPVAIALLRIGAYQLLHLDRIPGPIAVSATQDAASALGVARIKGLLNGVLRRVAERGASMPKGDSDAAIGIRASVPDWWVGALRDRFGDAAEAEGLALRERATTTVRVGRGTADELRASLSSGGFQCEPAPHGTFQITGPGDPFSSEAFREGRFVPQDPASLAIVDLLGDVAGVRVLDLCAGRGIKATALAQRGAQVVATDIGANKLRALERLADKIGVRDRIEVHALDGRDLPETLGVFDKVLVDAPCTGLGTVRRHPEIAWRRRPDDVHKLTVVQRALLASAATRVAPGGELVYAVCSFVRAEGDVPIPSGFEEVERVDFAPSSGLDAFQARRFRRGPA